MTKQYRQYDLEAGEARLTCWLEGTLKLRSQVRLKGEDDRWWTVVRVGDVRLDDPPDTRWKVGGLR